MPPTTNDFEIKTSSPRTVIIHYLLSLGTLNVYLLCENCLHHLDHKASLTHDQCSTLEDRLGMDSISAPKDQTPTSLPYSLDLLFLTQIWLTFYLK